MDSIEEKSLTQSRFQLGTPLVLPLAMLLIVIIISVAFVLYATAHGVGITPDSVSYASSAQSFASSFSFTQFDGLPLTLFPPGFPAVLGVFLALGLSFQFTAVFVSVLALVALLIFTFAVGRGLSRSMWRGAFAAAFVGLSSSTVFIGATVWSEGVFCAGVMGVLWVLVSAIHSQSLSRSRITLLVILSAMVLSSRYTGIVIIPIIFVGVFWSQPKGTVRRSLIFSFCVTGLCSIIELSIILRNLLLGAGVFGTRYPAEFTWTGMLHDVLLTLGGYVSTTFPSFWIQAIGVAIILAMVLATVRAKSQHDNATLLLALFVLLYWIALVYGQISTRLDHISFRLVAPALASMVLLVFSAFRLPHARHHHGSPNTRVAILTLEGALLALAGWIIIGGVIFTNSVASNYSEMGIGYNRQSFLNSPLASVIAKLPPTAGVAAYDAEGLYWPSKHVPIVMLPIENYYCSSQCVADQQSEFLQDVANGSVTYYAYQGAGMTPKQIEQLGVHLSVDVTVADGTLYRITRG